MFAPDAIDLEGRRLAVVQQIKLVQSRLVLAPPKRGKSRKVPLPDTARRRCASTWGATRR